MHAGKLFNDSEASNCAGLIIEHESGPVSAVEWYQRALDNDDRNSDAMFNMAMLYLKDKEEVEWHEEAINMLKRAQNLGNSQAN
jgi:TPR repeat protein